MAYTVTRYKTVFGNKKAVGMDITADAATQAIETGLSRIEWINWSPQSMTSTGIAVSVNSNASGVQSFGVVGVSGCATGDRFFVTAYGV
jgi:hypothetical protein